jgi:hypothetical protein
LLVSSVETILFLNLVILNSPKAKSLGAAPCNHFASQNRVFFPLPMCIYVEQKNKALLEGSCTLTIFFHNLSLLSQLCHNHLSLRALLNFSISLIPRPPSLLGLRQVSQITKQCPPFTFWGSYPLHRKLLLYLSNSSNSSFWWLKDNDNMSWHS